MTTPLPAASICSNAIAKTTYYILFIFALFFLISTKLSAQVSCKADFIFTIDQATKTVIFTDKSAGAVTNWNWRFGDTTTDTKNSSPSHTYTKNGNYPVYLAIETSDMCIDSITKVINIGCGIVSDFTFIQSGLKNTIDFTNQSSVQSGMIDSYNWDFGDGSPYSQDKSPSHTYANGGTYDVTFSVNDTKNPACYISNKKPVFVKGSTACDMYAGFDVTVNALSVLFTNTSSNTSSVYWDFGDGGYSYKINPEYTYARDGGYYVTLTVSDSANPGCQNSFKKYITVGQGGCTIVPDFTFESDPQFTNVYFYNQSLGSITNYYWDFGDGTYAKEKSLEHIYSKAGGYNVTLTVSDATVPGCQKSYTSFMEVGTGGCTTSAAFTFITQDDSNKVAFSNTSQGIVSAFFWDFGDGTYSKEENPVHFYSKPGAYKATLTVKNTNLVACQSIYTTSFKVGSTGCDLLAKFTSVGDSMTFKFADNSYGAIKEWHWDFGTGEFSSKQNAFYIFKREGYYKVCLTISDSSGCQNSFCTEIKVGLQNACQAKFSAFPDVSTNTVSFTDQSVGNTSSWYWDFGNGDYSKEQNPKYSYLKPGYYTVCLRTYDAATNCASSYCDYVKAGVSADCQARFSALPSGLNVRFSDASLGDLNEWYWNFGDGNYSYKQSPYYTYARAGYYKVTLSVRNTTTRCVSEYTSAVQVGEETKCVAGYKYFVDITSGKVSFSNASLGSSTEWYWDFGNGSYSTEEHPVYTYTKAGYYKVCLSVYDKLSQCQSTYCDYIKAGSSVTEDCLSQFSAQPKEGTNTLVFNDESMGVPSEWFWDFGDGTTSSLQSPEHTYIRSGYYKVCLSTRNASCKSYTCNEIHVGTGDCKTVFSFYNDPVKKQVLFTDMSYGNPTTYYWNLGDGKYSVEKNPSHTYLYEGIYTVCLSTYDSVSQCGNSYCQEIKAGSGGIDCEAKFESFTKDKTVYFEDRSSGSADSWFWDFGDGNFSKDQNPNNTYIRDGYYSVCLTISNSGSGCSNTYCSKIIIGDATTTDCDAKFSFVINPLTKEVAFKDESYGNPLKWSWTFGNSGTSNLNNPKFRFEKDTVYAVTLSIANASGCRKTYSNVVAIGQEGIFANYIYKMDTTYYFKNQATYPVSFYGSAYGKPAKWKWAFGDGNYDSLRVNPIHTYNDAGTYNACLTITDPVAKLSSMKCSLVKVGLITGIQEEKTALKLTVYPNPAIHTIALNYSLPQVSDIQLSITDINGRTIKTFGHESQSAGTYKQTMDLTELQLADGLYLVRLSINGKYYNTPVIIKK